jgi:hypothetical protein
MATNLIDTNTLIMSQIHASWNQWCTTEDAMKMMYGVDRISEHLMDIEKKTRNLKPAEEFKKNEAPWNTRETVLAKNTVHANNLIRLYISLNIDLAERRPIWQFFEIGKGIVGKIKEDIKTLKRVQKVKTLEQQLELENTHYILNDPTDLFKYRGQLSLDDVESDLKQMAKEAAKKARDSAKASAKAAKILAAIQAKAEKTKAKAAKKAKDDSKLLLDVAENMEKQSLEKGKLDKKLAKKALVLLKWAEDHDYTIDDIVDELEYQVKSSRSDNMVTIIDIV